MCAFTKDNNDEAINIKPTIYTSKDMGTTWDIKKISLPEVEGENVRVGANTKINADGSLLITSEVVSRGKYYNTTDGQTSLDKEENSYSEAGVLEAFTVDISGNITKLDVSNNKIRFYDDLQIDASGNFYYHDIENKKIVQLNNSFEATKEFKPEFKTEYGDISKWVIGGESLYTFAKEASYKFDIESGKNKGKIDIDESLLSSSDGIYLGKDSNICYSVNRNGVYKFKLGSKESSKVVDGISTSFGDSNNTIRKFIEINEEEFIVAFNKIDGGAALKLFKYDAELTNENKKEIIVYSMYGTDAIRKAIDKFQSDNPSVAVKLEVGVSDISEENIDYTGIINKLNIDLLAGKGPDVIFLNELPIRSYSEKGVLEDLSDIVKGNNNLFSGIVDSSKYTDGKLYSMPLTFSLATISGKNIGDVSDLNSLSNKIEELSSNAKGTVLNVYSPKELVALLYNSCGNNWLNNDKTINKENLEEFLEATKKIYSLIEGKHSSDHKQEYSQIIAGSEDELLYSTMINNRTLLTTKNTVEFIITEQYSYSDIFAFENLKEHGIVSNNWTGQGTSIGNVIDSVGVNANSANKAEAKAFINSLIAGEYYRNNLSFGFPINKENFIEYYNNEPDDDPYAEEVVDPYVIPTSYKKMAKDKFDQLLDKLNSATVSVVPDKEIYTKIIDEMSLYIKGEKTLDETMNSIDSKLKIYLAE